MAVSVSKKAIGIGLTDAAALLFIFAVPALSHLSALPFYLMDPMRVAVLGALLVSRNWKNGLALAVALPLCECPAVRLALPRFLPFLCRPWCFGP